MTLTSGRTVDQVADDLGLGRSTLNRWRKKLLEAELLAGPHVDPARELAPLRKKNELFLQERDLQKTIFTAKKGNR